MMCSVLLLHHGGLGTGGGGAGSGGEGGAGGGVEEGEEEAEEGDGNREGSDGSPGHGPTEEFGQANFKVATAYRDGLVVVSSFAPRGEVLWHGSLLLDEDGALLFVRGDAPLDGAVGGLAPLWLPSGGMPLVALADGGQRACGGVMYATFGGMACSIDVVTGEQLWASGRVLDDAP